MIESTQMYIFRLSLLIIGLIGLVINCFYATKRSTEKGLFVKEKLYYIFGPLEPLLFPFIAKFHSRLRIALILIMHFSMAILILLHIQMYFNYAYSKIIYIEVPRFTIIFKFIVFLFSLTGTISSFILLGDRIRNNVLTPKIAVLHALLDVIIISWLAFYLSPSLFTLYSALVLTEMLHAYFITRTGSHFIYYITSGLQKSSVLRLSFASIYEPVQK